MKRTIYLLLILILPVFLMGQPTGQENVNPDGYNKFYFDNGKISSEGTMRGGKPDGYWKTYFPNGKIKTEGNRKNFLLDSTWKFYNEDGKLITEIEYKTGKKNGIKRTHSPGGYIVSEELFENDIKQGASLYYFPSGKVKQRVQFDKGKEEGVAFEYDEEGIIINIIEYKLGFMRSQEKINRKDAQGLRTGMWKEFYPDGKVKTEVTFSEGKKHGYYKEFDPKGQLLNVYKYVMDVIDTDAPELARLDVKTEYYEDGTKKYEGTFKEGKPVGVHNLFDTKGEITKTKLYTDEGILAGEGIMDVAGNQQGPWIEYHQNGQVKGKGEYKDGKRIGEWTFFHPNGKTEQKGKYDKKGRAQGEWKWYYESGNLLREETYLNDLREGPMTEYSDTGNIVTKGEFVEGMKEGKWVYYMGDYRDEGEYKGGQMSGEWKSWHTSTGKIKSSGSFIDGNPDGRYKEYNIAGNILQEGKYIVGNKEGEWKYYGYNDETGLLEFILIITYRTGKEIKWDNVIVRPETD